ncbi:hypothetical protein SEA_REDWATTLEHOG_191 [Gordonia phage RedWattleHog]|nr:hypothetical protein SEA_REDWATTLEHOG_191 [Gordonia phage RedWattleHog]
MYAPAPTAREAAWDAAMDIHDTVSEDGHTCGCGQDVAECQSDLSHLEDPED